MSEPAQRLYFIRHGQREDFDDPTWQQRAARPYDTPLSATGFRQAADVGRFLQGQGVQALYASPFLRALQTADAIATALNLRIRVEPGFSEWLNPAWLSAPPELPDSAAARLLFPRVDPDYRPLGSATFPEVDERIEVFARVRATLQAILHRAPGEHLAIVAHGSPLGQSMGLLIPNTPGIHMQVASITRVDRIGDRFQLVHSGIEHLHDQNQELRFH